MMTVSIVAVKVFRMITHIIAPAMLIRVYTLMECPSARCKNKTRPKNVYKHNSRPHTLIDWPVLQATLIGLVIVKQQHSLHCHRGNFFTVVEITTSVRP